VPFNELDETRLRRLIQIGADLVANFDLESLLTTIVEDAREMTGAAYGALGILNPAGDGLERFIHSGIDEAAAKRIGSLPQGRGVLGVLIDDPRPIRLHDVSEHEKSFGFPEGHPPMHSFLGVPVTAGGEAYGNLYLTDKPGGDFTKADLRAVETLAVWAGIAIANARSVREDRLRAAIAASESERHRWALELHDETLQGLGALRFMLSAAERSGDPEVMHDAIEQSLEQLSLEITGLRALITELRPAALDTLGLEAALENLASRAAGTGDFNLEIDFEFAPGSHRDYAGEQEVTAYRLVQEGLSNATKHAGAKNVMLHVERTPREIEIEIRDDGVGFDPATSNGGFGLVGMRERVALIRGRLDVKSSPGGGTTIHATLPAD